MLKVDKCEVQIKGPVPVLKAELSTLLQCCREQIGNKEVDDCVKNSKKTIDEIKKENEEMADLLNKPAKFLGSNSEDE